MVVVSFKSSFVLLSLLIFVVSTNVYSVSSQQEVREGETLLFAHVLFRHGDRTPIEPYPNDPWKDPSYWPTGWGQLTNAGKHRHLELGRWLRKRYHNFLPATFSVNNIYIQSTDVDRTLMSVESNLAGLYPPVQSDVWEPTLPWQPIPVHTIPEYMDSVLAAKKLCPAFDHAFKKYKHTEEFQAYNKSLEQIYRYTTIHTGRKMDSPTSLGNLYSCLYIEEINNFTLPAWTNEVYPEPLRTIAARTFAMRTNTTDMARLKVGPLIKEMLMRFKSKINKTLSPNRSIWVYSGHDTTVANVLNALHLFDVHNPPFAACVLLELYQPRDGSEPYVSIYYRNSTAEPDAFSIPKCGKRCPLTRMFEVYEEILPDNWESECKLSLLSLSYVEADMQSSYTLIALLLMTIISIFFILMGLATYWRRHNGYYNEHWYLRIDG